MKIKLIYIYVALISALIVYLFLSNRNLNTDVAITSVKKKNTGKIVNTKMGNPVKPNPSKENVNKNIFHKLEKFKEAIEKNPNDTLMIKKYAKLLSLSHKTSEAVKYYKKLLQINPNRTDILFELSFIYYSKMNYKDALNTTKKILKITPKNVKAYYNVGAIYATMGKKNNAKKIWEDIIENYSLSKESKLAIKSLKKLK